METKKLNIKFYQNIAKVFYAVAKVDHIIHVNEVKVLKKVVKDKWLMIDETYDVFGTDTAYQIEIVFDWLYSKSATANDCFEDFIEYYHNHTHFFTDQVKKLIVETCNLVANAFRGTNKLELLMIEKLETTLGNLNYIR